MMTSQINYCTCHDVLCLLLGPTCFYIPLRMTFIDYTLHKPHLHNRWYICTHVDLNLLQLVKTTIRQLDC